MANGLFDGGDAALTESEQAYFDSRGETPIEPEAPAGGEGTEQPEKPAEKPAAEPEKPAAPAKEPEKEAKEASATEEDLASSDELDTKTTQVPLWALKEQREKARLAEEKVRQLEERHERLAKEREELLGDRERLRIYNERVDALTKEPEQEIPDPEVEPLAYERYRRELVEQKLAEIERNQQATIVKTDTSAITAQARAFQSEFATKNPDYWEALKYFEDGKRRQLSVLYPNDPAKVEQEIVEDRGRLVFQSIMRHPDGSIRFIRDPSETVYKLAHAAGYVKADENGDTPPAKRAAPRRDAEEEISSRKKRATASMSLSSVGGSEGSGSLTLERLINMEEPEYLRLLKEKPDLVDSLMGKGRE